jgi:hypothetical protein
MRSFAIIPAFRALMPALLLVMLGNGIAVAQTSDELKIGGNRGTQMKRVFVNVTGDPKLSRRLWMLIGFELEDASFQRANTDDDADTVVDGKIETRVAKVNLGLGVIRMQATAGGRTQNLDSCATLNGNESGEVFNGAATRIGETLREKYPDASTIRIDPASNTTQSESFPDELARSLRKANFKIVETSPSDITLRVELVREKVPVEEKLVDYELAVSTRDGMRQYPTHGTIVGSAMLAGPPPALCPSLVNDLDWLSDTSTLYQVVQVSVKEMKKQRSQSLAPNQEIKK